MYEFSECELFVEHYYAKSIDEDIGAKIIEQFQLEHTVLAQTIFGIAGFRLLKSPKRWFLSLSVYWKLGRDNKIHAEF
ncbi:MAG: hypothetical protein Q8S55_22095 [Methylococcaceae bacterium]|jgi:hypothetical protein|nr:hypothetical protein [Methylococcaceae bacterium]